MGVFSLRRKHDIDLDRKRQHGVSRLDVGLGLESGRAIRPSRWLSYRARRIRAASVPATARGESSGAPSNRGSRGPAPHRRPGPASNSAVAPANINVSIRVLSPGDNGSVSQTNTSPAIAALVDPWLRRRPERTTRRGSGCGPSRGAVPRWSSPRQPGREPGSTGSGTGSGCGTATGEPAAIAPDRSAEAVIPGVIPPNSPIGSTAGSHSGPRPDGTAVSAVPSAAPRRGTDRPSPRSLLPPASCPPSTARLDFAATLALEPPPSIPTRPPGRDERAGGEWNAVVPILAGVAEPTADRRPSSIPRLRPSRRSSCPCHRCATSDALDFPVRHAAIDRARDTDPTVSAPTWLAGPQPDRARCTQAERDSHRVARCATGRRYGTGCDRGLGAGAADSEPKTEQLGRPRRAERGPPAPRSNGGSQPHRFPPLEAAGAAGSAGGGAARACCSSVLRPSSDSSYSPPLASGGGSGSRGFRARAAGSVHRSIALAESCPSSTRRPCQWTVTGAETARRETMMKRLFFALAMGVLLLLLAGVGTATAGAPAGQDSRIGSCRRGPHLDSARHTKQ